MRRGSGWKQNFMDMPAGRQVRATYRSALIRSGHGAIGPIGGGLTGGVTIRSSARSGLAIEFLRSTSYRIHVKKRMPMVRSLWRASLLQKAWRARRRHGGTSIC